MMRDERGQALVMAALVMTVLLGICGLVVDLGYAYVIRDKAQNAVDAAALAGAQALYQNPGSTNSAALNMAEANGMKSNDIAIHQNGSSVTVTDTQTVDFIFMPALGIRSKAIRASATAKVSHPVSFNYAVFSGSTSQPLTINLNGTSNIINGNVHTNMSMQVNGTDNQFNGNTEAVENVQVNGTANYFKQIINSAPRLPIPPLDLTYYKDHATKIYNQDESFSGTNSTLNGILFVNGNVTISGFQVSGVGTIVATGSITVNGTGIQYSSGTSYLGLYSASTAGITINGNNVTVDGGFYAPNGSINVNGTDETFNGALIAQTVNMNGYQNTVTYDPNVVADAPDQSAKLTQ